MPLYEYACASCGKRYEKREGFDALARQKCQVCGKGTAQRVLHAPPVVFKGSGFYKNDSRGADRASSEKSSSSSGTDTSSKDESPSPKSEPKEKASAAPPSKDSPATEAAAAG